MEQESIKQITDLKQRKFANLVTKDREHIWSERCKMAEVSRPKLRISVYSLLSSVKGLRELVKTRIHTGSR